MLNSKTLISVIEVLLVTVPTLLTVAFVTIAERKTIASMQIRLASNDTGYCGSLQAFVDPLNLLLKQYVGPMQVTACFALSLQINVCSLSGFTLVFFFFTPEFEWPGGLISCLNNEIAYNYFINC